MGKHIEMNTRVEIIALFKSKKTLKYISKETGVPKSTVHDIIKRYRKNNSFNRVGISGRKKILNDKDVTYLINDIKKNPKSSSNEIRKKLEDRRGKKVTNTTIRN